MKHGYQNHFAPVYDDFVGDRNKVVQILQKIIIKHAPQTKTIMELACGTGSLLFPFSKKYRVTGVDLSSEMLRQARKKLPNATLLKGDARNVKTGGSFDFVFMLFDSINHLFTIKAWGQVLQNTADQLQSKGLFLMDFNTIEKLDFLSLQSPATKLLNKGKVLTLQRVTKKDKIYTWHIKLYRRNNTGFVFVSEENINEVSFSVKQVIKLFRKYFVIRKIFDERNKKPNRLSKRIYILGQVRK